jgi:hypothetical protein
MNSPRIIPNFDKYNDKIIISTDIIVNLKLK